MKTNLLPLLLAAWWFSPVLAPAQVGTTNRPILTVTAPVPQAAEPAQRGWFRLFRDGPTNQTLLVQCVLEGTATHGVDYERIPTVIPLRAGSRVVELPVSPIDDALVEGPETVILRLLPPLATDPGYALGTPASALVTIEDNDRPAETNRPPEVRLLQPTNGASYTAGAHIRLVAEAHDADGSIASVEFFAGTNLLGRGVLDPLPLPPLAPYIFVWSNAPAGEYALRALATDDRGARTASEPVRLLVQAVQPVVTLRVVDALATEPTTAAQVLDTAVFLVTRDRGTNLDLPVALNLRGTASNGVDYATIASRVLIPRGAYSTEIVIRPLQDSVAEEPESVVLSVAPSPACLLGVWPPPAECYQSGEPSLAEARIMDATRSNHPPAIVLLRPEAGASFPSGQIVGLLADTWDADGYVTQVEFFAGTNKLAEVERRDPVPPTPGLHVSFQYLWTNAPLGRHELSARATDNNGLRTVTPGRLIVVTNLPPPPPPAGLPEVTLVVLDSLAVEGTNCWRWPGLGVCTNCPPTNCGPNVATFAVRRSGPTNDSLRVAYRVGGTASNGVDYVRLPGVMVVPAGERVARILVQPLDDRVKEPLETVEIGLVPPPADAATLATYTVGTPNRGAAIIVDDDADRPTSRPLGEGLFHLQVEALNGTWLQVEVTTDLRQWRVLGTCEVTDGALHFVDADAAGSATRFYRVTPALPPDLN